MSYYAYAHDAVSVGLGALATIALFASVPAAANEPEKVNVSYSDLDLTSQSGQETLDERIRGAAKRVCGSETRSALDAQSRNACRRAAYRGAHTQMQVAIAKAGERKALAINTVGPESRPGLR